MPHFRFDEQSREPVVAHGGVGRVLARRVIDQEGASAINFIDLVDVPPAASIGLHRHDLHDEEIYVIISGTGRMIIDGTERRVASGDVLLNGPGDAHSLFNDGEIPIRIVVIDVAMSGMPYVQPVDLV